MQRLLNNIFKSIPFRFIHYGTKIPFLNFEKIREIRPYFEQPEIQKFRSQQSGRTKNGARVVIYGLRSHVPSDLAVFEKVLSDVLENQGVEVFNLLCGGVLKSCDGVNIGQSHRYSCNMCRNQRDYFIKLYPNHFLQFSNFIGEDAIGALYKEVAGLEGKDLLQFQFDGIELGQHALNSCNKYYRYGVFNQDDEKHLQTLRHNVWQGMIVTEVAKQLIEKIQPTHLVTIHGGYSTWGPIADYFAKAGRTVYRYEKSINQVGSFYINKLGEDLNDIVAREVWEESCKKALSVEKRETLRKFCMAKKKGTSFEYRLYQQGKRDSADKQLMKVLDQQTGKKKFALYPHVIWDKGYISRYDGLGGFFQDDIEWMFETVRFFWNRDDSLLFIKPHPGERLSFDFTSLGSKEIILEHFGKLPDHIIAIDNDYPISSFDLMDRGCIGLVYTSTVGLEHSYFKKPVIVAGNIHYKFGGAVHPVNSREEYFRLIDNPKPLFDFIEKEYDVIEKYAYHYYFTQQVVVPFYRKDVFMGHCIEWEVLRNYRTFIESDPIINNVAQSIISGQSVIMPP